MVLGFITPFAVHAQPVIFLQPIGQEVGIGADVTFRVGAGNGTLLPLRYHWRLNGERLRGATNATLTVSNVQPRNAGSYSVTVADPRGSVNSSIARLSLTVPALPFSDDFNSRTNQIVGLAGLAGIGRGNNTNASREKGEPFHAGHGGSHSVWLTWRPPVNGIANISTAGSGFDTLLAVYTGPDLTNLTEVAASDDQGGFHTSSVQFNATGGTVYHIAVDGRARAAGEIVLLWRLEVTPELLPNITAEPLNTIGPLGDRISLAVRVDTLTNTGIQWLFNGQEISAATSDVLDLGDLQRTKVGKYVARIRRGTHEILSEPVEIQIHVRGDGTVNRNVRAGDKFNDVADLIASSALQPQGIQPSRLQFAASAPARGYTGTQIFSTFGATKEEGEPNHCGEPGGVSEWYAYQAEADGIITIDTDGSDFDTVLAVYTGPGTDFDSLVEVACDKDSGQDGKDSKTSFAVKAGTVYFIAVDGVDGASGTVTLNYNLLVPPRISAIPDQTTDEDTPTGTINFTVDSANPQATNFTLMASSSNPNLVPNENIFFGANGTNQTIRIIPAANQFGTATITVTASDGMTSASRSFAVTVDPVNQPVNHPPTISDIPIQVFIVNYTVSIPFTVGDNETAATNLVVSATLSDTRGFSIVSLDMETNGVDRVLKIVWPGCGGGAAQITVTVADGDGGTASDTFMVVAGSHASAPFITQLQNQATPFNTATPPIPFVVGDSETAASNLVVIATSSNTNLLPTANIVFAGTENNRTVTLVPATNQTGWAVLTLTVVARQPCPVTSSTTFTLEVTDTPSTIPGNHPPTISDIADQTMLANTTLPIPFSVGDADTPATNLVVSASLSNTNEFSIVSLDREPNGVNWVLKIAWNGCLGGPSQVTVIVADGEGGTASDTFMMKVGYDASAPFITQIQNRATPFNTATPPIPFSLGDAVTTASNLVVTATSSNTNLLPTANIVFAGTEVNRTMTLVPATNQTGWVVITLTVVARQPCPVTSSTTFTLEVTDTPSTIPGNYPPTISDIANQGMLVNTTLAIPFSVGDADTPATNLIVSATLSNTNGFSIVSLDRETNGVNWVLRIASTGCISGISQVTVTVTDGDAGTASDTLTLHAGGDPYGPFISPIQNQATPKNTATAPILFAVSDSTTAASNLVVTATSSNTNLLPTTNIVFAGTENNRTVTLIPATDQTGLAVITLSVVSRQPCSVTSSKTFTLTVNPTNTPPTISFIPDITMSENTSTPPLNFTVNDAETDASRLTLAASYLSSPSNLIQSVVFGGTGTTRTVTSTPTTNFIGTAVVTVVVADEEGAQASTTFTLNVRNSVLPEIRLNAQSILTGGALQLRLTGFTGQGALIQSSTDLKSWESIYTNTVPDGQLPPLDFETAAQPWLFFRALLSK